jgi:hypothetical protein
MAVLSLAMRSKRVQLSNACITDKAILRSRYCRLARTLKQRREQQSHAMQHKRQQQQRSEQLLCEQKQPNGMHWACHMELS